MIINTGRAAGASVPSAVQAAIIIVYNLYICVCSGVPCCGMCASVVGHLYPGNKSLIGLYVGMSLF